MDIGHICWLTTQKRLFINGCFNMDDFLWELIFAINMKISSEPSNLKDWWEWDT
jgi:hypothetical protein